MPTTRRSSSIPSPNEKDSTSKNIGGFHIAVWQAVVTLNRMTVVPSGLYVESPMEVGIFLSEPYATSPMLVFIGLVAGTILVRLLAEVVTHGGLVNGYAVFFAGDLLLSTLRMIDGENPNPTWMDTLKSSAGIVACCVLTLNTLMKLRPAQTVQNLPHDARLVRKIR